MLNAATLEALVMSGRDTIAKLKIFTTPDKAHAPITVDEDSACSVSPLHWLCMQHSHASGREGAISSSTLQKVVDAFPEACAIAGPAGNTPLHLLCMGEYTTSAHLLTISAALSSCWEEQNENGDRPLDLLVAERKLTPGTVFDLIKHTPRVAEVPLKDMRNRWSKEPITVLHWICYTVSREPEPGIRSSLLGHLPATVDYKESLKGLILEHGQVDHEGVWRRDLAHLKKGALRKRALLEGVPADAVDEAEEAYDPKTALVDLIVARLQTKDHTGVALRAEVSDLYSKDSQADQKRGTEGREQVAGSGGGDPVRANALHNRAVVVGLQRVIGAFPDAVLRQDEEGRTPLHIYCTHNAAFADAINVLAKEMTNQLSKSIHFRDAYSNSALDLLLAHGALSVDLLEKLVGECSTFATGEIKDTHGPDCSDFGPAHVTKLADDYITPLHWLCAQPDLTLRSLQVVMVAAGGAAAEVDGHGQTPLHYLCKNKAAAAPEMLALFQTLNENAVAAIDSKQVIVSQASAENMVGRPELARSERNAGDKARDILASKLAEQTNRVRSIKKRQALREKQRRRAAEAASSSPRAVRQAQDHVDRRAKVAVKTMKLQSVQKTNQRLSSIRGAHFLSSPRRSLHTADKQEHAGHSMAEIIAGIPDSTAIVSTGRFQLQHSWQQLSSAGGHRLNENVNNETRCLVDWAAKDHSGTTALHVLCTNPTRSTRKLLCWAAGSPATTAAWFVPNRDGRTPLDVLQFTCRPENVNQALTAKLLKELVVQSDGRLAAVPLRELSDAPVVPMVEPTPGDLSLLAFACGDPRITEQDLAEITYAYPQALIHTSGKLCQNPLHVLCANPHARTAHIRCIVLSPCGREAVAAQDARGNTPLHVLCQNARAVCEDACAVIVAEYTPVISVQNCIGRLPIHYAASLGIESGLDAPELERLLKLLSVAPSMPGRKRPKRRGRTNGLAPTRDIFGHTPLEILARNGNAGAGLVKAVAGTGKLGVSDGRSDALIGEAPIGAVDHQLMR
jgi:ankyrin repeat protein